MTGLPLHPTLVHFPVAFYFLELLLLIFWKARNDERYRRFADFSFKAAYVSMIAAMAAGYWDAGGDWKRVVSGPAAGHFYGAIAVFFFYTCRALYFKTAGERARSSAIFRISAAVAGNALVFYAAYLGGRLVYLS